jgi:hypothetical protein
MEASLDRCPQEHADGAFSVVLPGADELNISALDRAALDVSLPMTEAGKKLQQQAERLGHGFELREQSNPYRVEREIGRFSFLLYEAMNEQGSALCQGVEHFLKRLTTAR